MSEYDDLTVKNRYNNFTDDFIIEFNNDLRMAYENINGNLFIENIIKQGTRIQDIYNKIRTNLSENILVFMFSYTPCKNCDISKYIMEQHSYQYILLDNIFPYDTSKNYLVIFRESEIFHARTFYYLANSYNIYETKLNDIISSIKYKDTYIGDILYYMFKNEYKYNYINNVDKYGQIYYIKDKLNGLRSICHLWGGVLNYSHNIYQNIYELPYISNTRVIIDYIKNNYNIINELQLYMYLKEYILYPVQKYFEDTQNIFEQYNMIYPTKESKKERSIIYSKLIKENKIKSKWKNEQLLFRIVSEIFPDAIYQYHDKWLNMQSLDIYIPSLKLGIEYQGEQHFKEIDFFGGKDGLEKNIERDRRKKDICKNNGVTIIYWNFYEPINPITVKEKLTLHGFS